MIFYCVSHFDGSLELLDGIDPKLSKIYSKGKDQIPNSEKLENYGYNLSSYFKFIIDNYNNLPDRIGFFKNNVFPRHVKKETFKQYLTEIEDFIGIEEPKSYTHRTGVSFFDKKLGFFEINSSWYLTSRKTKYFYSFNHFMNTIFTNYKKLDYVNFVPGANFIINKKLILKYPKNFYHNLNLFMKHHEHANEAHLIERAIKIIFTNDLILNKNFENKISNCQLKKMALRTVLLRKTLLLKIINKFL